MKKLLMICGLLLGVAGLANAQQAKGDGKGMRGKATPEERVKRLDEKLKLTDDQKTKLTALFTSQQEDMKKMREDMKAENRSEMKDKMTKWTADNDAKITAVLNDEQKKAYQTWRDEQQAKMKERMEKRQNKEKE